MGIPGYAVFVPRDLVSEQLLPYPAFVQIWAAWVKGPLGESIALEVSVSHRNLQRRWWTHKSDMSIGHLVGKAPSLHVMITTPTSEFWRGRQERNVTLVLRNKGPCVSCQASRMLGKPQQSLPVPCICPGIASFGASSKERSR